MYEIKTLALRNIKVFLRDKTAVFFSFLSVIIMLALYFLFLGKQYTSGLAETVDKNLTTYLSVSQMMGGILIINTLSLSLGMMGNLITDLEQHLLEGFLVTPVKRWKIILSYCLSSVIVTFILSVFMWLLTFLYVGVASGYWYDGLVFMKVTAIILLSTVISTAIMIFLTTLLKSMNAFSTLSGILGTFVGFVSGIYMPLSVLGKGVSYFSSIVPFTHLTIMLKKVLLEKPFILLEALGVPDESLEVIKLNYGYNEIGLFGITMPMWIIILIFVVISTLLLLLSFRKMIKRIENI